MRDHSKACLFFLLSVFVCGNLFSSNQKEEGDPKVTLMISHECKTLKALPNVLPHLPDGPMTQQEIEDYVFGIDLYMKGFLSVELQETLKRKIGAGPSCATAFSYVGGYFRNPSF